MDGNHQRAVRGPPLRKGLGFRPFSKTSSALPQGEDSMKGLDIGLKDGS